MIRSFITMICLLMMGCKPYSHEGHTHKTVKIQLVQYRIAKHSHVWFKELETGKIHDIGGLGGRKKPTIQLGDVIDGVLCYDTEPPILYFNIEKYTQSAAGELTKTFELK